MESFTFGRADQGNLEWKITAELKTNYSLAKSDI